MIPKTNIKINKETCCNNSRSIHIAHVSGDKPNGEQINKMKTRKELVRELKDSRPNVCVQVIASHDENYTWDGDGPSPKGFYPHDVEVKTTTITGGEIKTGSDHLGGCYARKTHNFNSPQSNDFEIHGYFPQMLEAALGDMDK